MKQKEKTPNQLRTYGITMAVAFLILGAFFHWRNLETLRMIMFILGPPFLLLAFIAPNLLRPIEKAWMNLALILGNIVTPIVLTLTFFLVITPMGLFLRLIGKDLLDIKMQKDRNSFWVAVDPEGPGSRPDTPY